MTKCPTCKITEGTLYDGGYFYPRESQIDDDRAHAEFDKERDEEYEKEKEFNEEETKKLVTGFIGLGNVDERFSPQSLKEFVEIWSLMQRAKEVGIIKIDWNK